jgi:hypothetical protein
VAYWSTRAALTELLGRGAVQAEANRIEGREIEGGQAAPAESGGNTATDPAGAGAAVSGSRD